MTTSEIKKAISALSLEEKCTLIGDLLSGIPTENVGDCVKDAFSSHFPIGWDLIGEAGEDAFAAWGRGTRPWMVFAHELRKSKILEDAFS